MRAQGSYENAPREQAGRQPQHPLERPFRGGRWTLRLERPRVVRLVHVEQEHVAGIGLGRAPLRGTVVHELPPAIASPPMFGDPLAVLEGDEHVDWKDRVAV